MSYSRDYLVSKRLPDRSYQPEELYDCVFDPQQRANVASDPQNAEILDSLRARLDRWPPMIRW